MARIRRTDLPSGFFHVTANSIPEAMLFRDDRDRLLFVLHLGRAVRRAGLTLHACCVMGTHYHVVVEGSPGQLSRAFHWLNSHYAREYNARHGRRGSLLSERFASWVIQDEDHLEATIEYVLANPVHAGLVDRPEDWPWSGRTEPNRTLVRTRSHG
jgi:REP element-mobilizing transposase RayT